MDPALAAQQTRFLEIWDEALKNYKTAFSGGDLSTIQLPDPANLEAFRQDIESSQSRFEKYREIRASLWKSLANFLVPIEMLGGVASQGAVAAFQASPAIMAAVSILIKGARGVSQSYDYIQELLNDIGPILSRLQIHARKDLPVELKQLYIDILACVLEIIGVSTKYVTEGRTKRFLKRILKPEDSRASELKVKLQTLVGQESTLVGALNLEATGSILETTKLTGKIISKLDSKIEDLANSVNQIPKQPKGNRPKNSDNNSRNEMLKKLRERMLPQLNLEDDLLNLKYLAGTGDWVLTEPLIQQWIEGNIPFLRLSGGPGAGKSHLSSFLVHHLLNMQKKTPDDISVSYFFFKDNDPRRNCFAIALRTIAYQIALSDPMYRQLVENTCQGIEDIGTLASVWRHLFRVFFATKFQSRIFIVLDGVDEAQRDQLVPFLKLLREFCTEGNQGHGRVNILMVGRWDIDWYVEEVFETQVPCVDILPGKNNEDINKYISHILAKSRNLKKTSPELQSEILSVLTSEADGMFLWADLMLKEISTKNREALIRESLQNLPRGLPDTYERMFYVFSEALIDEPDQIKDLNELLLWVGFASRPLSLAELEVILELRYGDGGRLIDLHDEITKKYASFFTISNIRYDARGRNTSAGLSLEQKYTSIVRLRHASLGDFLRLKRAKETPVGLKVDDPQLHCFKTCANFMADPENMPKIDTQFRLPEMFTYSRRDVSDGPLRAEIIGERSKLVFASYALHHWRSHFGRIIAGQTSSKDREEVLSYLHQIFTKPHILAARYQNHIYKFPSDTLNIPPDLVAKYKNEGLAFGPETVGYLPKVAGDMFEVVKHWILMNFGTRQIIVSVGTGTKLVGTEMTIDLSRLSTEDGGQVGSWVLGLFSPWGQRPLFFYPMIKEMYFLALGGGSELATDETEAPRFLSLMYDYISTLWPGYKLPISKSQGDTRIINWVDVKNERDNGRNLEPILEFISLEKNAIWYFSVAHILRVFGAFEAAQTYCVRASSATRSEDNFLRARICHLRYECAYASFLRTNSATDLRLAKVSLEIAIKEITQDIKLLENLKMRDLTPWSLCRPGAIGYLNDYLGFMTKYGWTQNAEFERMEILFFYLLAQFDNAFEPISTVGLAPARWDLGTNCPRRFKIHNRDEGTNTVTPYQPDT
ncbi:hypothetical protein TWF192_006693 [Orbilia oligospora]|uniref:Uncharacterized protein n=1 Tax=Orbilia oligospora TaxID=2813651 RepID=A0A6G1M615_ORBOL|nr:hypothetical protein TWF191_004079 [Orbilia oligospora]KAF3246880.1 hypothetical protein TWF192_006693 [Orbilia oligospora]